MWMYHTLYILHMQVSTYMYTCEHIYMWIQTSNTKWSIFNIFLEARAPAGGLRSLSGQKGGLWGGGVRRQEESLGERESERHVCMYTYWEGDRGKKQICGTDLPNGRNPQLAVGLVRWQVDGLVWPWGSPTRCGRSPSARAKPVLLLLLLLVYLYIYIYIYDTRVYPVIHGRWDNPEDRDRRVYVQWFNIYACLSLYIYIYIYIYMNM